MLRPKLFLAALIVPSAAHATTQDIGTVLNLGDSITLGQGVAGGFRTQFYQGLLASGYTYQAVGNQTSNASTVLTNAGETAHDGYSGWDIGAINYSVNNDSFIGTTKGIVPSYVTLLIGTNDFAVDKDSSSAPATAALDNLIGDIYSKTPNTRLVLSTIVPFLNATYNAAYESSLKSYNASMPAEVTKFKGMGYSISLVDSYSAFLNADGSINSSVYQSDGEHPDAAGYTLIGNLFASGVAAAVPEPASTALFAALGGLLLARRRRTVM